MKLTEIPPCETHQPHPHAHPVLSDGKATWRRACSGRYCCTRCGTWTPGKACHSDEPPKRKDSPGGTGAR